MQASNSSQPKNPWVEALRRKTAPIDLDQDVLDKVLQINPGLRQGAQSNAQVREVLLQTLTAPAPSAAQVSAAVVVAERIPAPSAARRPSAKFQQVFEQIVDELHLQLAAEQAAIKAERRALDERERRTQDEYIDRLVTFLAEMFPGALAEEARVVVQTHPVFKKLGLDAAEVERRVRARGSS